MYILSYLATKRGQVRGRQIEGTVRHKSTVKLCVQIVVCGDLERAGPRSPDTGTMSGTLT
jgi:hypothetical protein